MRYITLEEARQGIPTLYPKLLFADFKIGEDKIIKAYTILNIKGEVVESHEDINERLDNLEEDETEYEIRYFFIHNLLGEMESRPVMVKDESHKIHLKKTVLNHENKYGEIHESNKRIALISLPSMYREYIEPSDALYSHLTPALTLDESNKILGGEGLKQGGDSTLSNALTLYDNFCRLHADECCNRLLEEPEVHTKEELESLLSKEVAIHKKAYYRHKLKEMERQGLEVIQV